jgi:NodT family efflux transporter outer membrane factor (OMF) lipoprotein
MVVACSAAGCAVGPDYRAPAPDSAARFQAQLPQAGQAGQAGQADQMQGLAQWWRQFDDPLVAQLVEAAQADDPGLAQSLARVMQARAGYAAAGAARLPQLDLNADATRARSAAAPGAAVYAAAVTRSLDASWEIDLFGARAKAAEAADARWSARRADWHAARVSLAAEVAATLVDQRACAASADILAQDLRSREAVAQSTRDALQTGFLARADVFLSDASAAAARERLVAQRAACDLDIKALVALTGIAEPALRASLGASARLPRPRAFLVDAVPAQALAQRPDIAAAERELAAAAADINVAEAQRYPSLSLSGSIGIAGLRTGGASGSANTWSFGPVLTLPLFDGGRRKADAAAAQARYDEQAGVYRQRVRGAVREIEEALVRLDAAARREADADTAAREYERYFDGRGEKFRAGASGLLELEDARRNSLAARLAVVGVQRDRVNAWIALYKALGGGWQAAAPSAPIAPIAPIATVAASRSGPQSVSN